ncbi:acetolactate synthase large subunit [Chromatocurvus halotolerans]|uniref:Acetolactate synthase-1/2/3 large subunit n=1 Tax=Chromatocurvus halotolerans TaxID=1132028 RepID=A0A4R2KPN2_9GAMM|nr:acetolactate synthase large subunit [Chromatocurvus halotolerans]TCO74722.1 acetolactate synthase-1/2/3 large subunit [Chromatocurvus halotolerans]
MNGAQALLKTLADSEIDTCFANPGTSEMQLVSAIGETPGVRAVLCLFEGVVTGAADGYARMADRPALTLLHLGSGLSNGLANLHNARRAGSAVVNVVGDHATYHLQYDAPLTSDLPGLAAWTSSWSQVAASADEMPALGAEAVCASRAGNGAIATLIAPADCAWEQSSAPATAALAAVTPAVDADHLNRLVQQLQGDRPRAFFLGGRALREDCLNTLGRIAAVTGARLICQTFPARLQRGAGRVAVERLPYFAEQATASLGGLEQLILVGCAAPVSFFAYPGKESWLTPQGCEIITLASANEDIAAALASVAQGLEANSEPAVRDAHVPDLPGDVPLNAEAIGNAIAALLPENAIIVDEGVTGGLAVYLLTEGAAPHDWLTLTGGAIGQGLPVALGAAIARPAQKVIALQADGSAMYTVQALWSMVREQTDVTVVLLNNRSYAILAIELDRVGAGADNDKTRSLLDLSRPDMDFCAIAAGLGMRASRARTGSEFAQQFRDAMATAGPCLIEAMV